MGAGHAGSADRSSLAGWLALAGGLAGVGTAAALVAVLATGAANAQGLHRRPVDHLAATLHLIAERPLLGHGPEALGLLFPRSTPRVVYYEGRGVLVDRAHNFLHVTAVTTGLRASGLGVLWRSSLPGLARGGARTEPRTRALLAACLAAWAATLRYLVSFDVTATATTTVADGAGGSPGASGGPTARPAGAPVASPRPMRRGALATLAVVAGGGGGAACQYSPYLADAAALTPDRFAAAGEREGAIAAADRAVALAPQEPAYRRTLSGTLASGRTGDGTAAVNLPRAEAALWRRATCARSTCKPGGARRALRAVG